jgi:glutamyl-tRNA reductase
MNHRTAPVEVRERFAVDDPLPWLQKLVESEEIEEAVLLSTCNRVEVIATGQSLDGARHRLRTFFHRELGHSAPLPHQRSESAVLYEHVDSDAVRHLFRVAASIDSLVVGEPQILGQVKDAYRLAAEGGACGPLLNRLFTSAFAAAKRVRSETRIAARPVSMARVAVDLAEQIFETLADKHALLIGAGEMIEAALEALCGAGLASVAVANRTPERAAELAHRFGATAHGLDELPRLLAGADVVLSSIGADRPLLDAPLFEEALRARRRRPIFAIDLGVPRNVDPVVNRLDGVYLYDVDDLGGVAEANAEERRRETVRAEAIVQEEVERFDGWLSALQAVPTIRRLRARAEAIRQGELDKALGRLGLGETERQAVEALTRAIVNKILHAPVSRLRERAEREEGIAYLEAAKVLFALDDDGAPGAQADARSGGPAGDDEPGADGA